MIDFSRIIYDTTIWQEIFEGGFHHELLKLDPWNKHVCIACIGMIVTSTKFKQQNVRRLPIHENWTSQTFPANSNIIPLVQPYVFTKGKVSFGMNFSQVKFKYLYDSSNEA